MSAIIIPFPRPCRPLPDHADPRVLRIREILKNAVPAGKKRQKKGGAA